MIKGITNFVRFLTPLLLVFAFYWFLNSGFLTNPLWLPIQAALFTVVTLIIFKYQKVKISYWFLVVGLFYIASSISEIFELKDVSVMTGSTGFGILIIVILFQILKGISKRR